MSATIVTAPPVPPNHATARVGIFWQVPDTTGAPVLVTDTEPLDSAERYGDFLTHPRGHYDVWTAWQHRGAPFLRTQGWPLAILTTEYEVFPRGRVVLRVPANTFWIYADQRLQELATIAAIKAALGLTHETCLVKSDGHYI
jgi:hypothetical protein